MHPRFLDELLEGPASRRGKQLVARVRVVEGDLARRLGLLLEEGRLLPVAREFRIMSVEIADAIRRLDVAVPPQVLLDGRGGRACAVCGLLGGRVATRPPSSHRRDRRLTKNARRTRAVRLRLHDVLGAHDGARVLVPVGT